MLTPRDSELLLIHAALQVQYQHPGRAITLLDALLELEPGHVEARKMLSVACLQTGRNARAAMLCEELLREGTEQDEAGLWLCLSQARWRQSDTDGARQAHQRYTKFLNSESNEQAD